jgi:hypothetical protein
MNIKRIFVMLALALTVLSTAALASAGGYSQGDVTITPQIGFYGLLNKNTNTLLTYGVDLGYFVADGLELGLRGQGVYLTTQYSNSLGGSNSNLNFNGGGGEGYLRWHFFQFANNAGSVFAEVGAGALWFSDTNDSVRLYNGGQFSGIAGLGLKYALGQNINVALSANYRHIGNFDSSGIDGLGGSFGLQFTF